ncbi:hypothetical protein OG897_08395 [Streptomyces sp. NBC_00237]|uniref:hypothetical protein n=1 Tax=Streptomyces sp. NBC_00237 TaxID=2975687 RepID=UPI00225976FE|nr:hypothetical protein [Streptomyces sp. NBC_00237]MCX5201470.1 hypothetical protein [Streptomyces sp. NBC_00237]
MRKTWISVGTLLAVVAVVLAFIVGKSYGDGTRTQVEECSLTLYEDGSGVNEDSDGNLCVNAEGWVLEPPK